MGVKATHYIRRSTAIEYLENQNEEIVLDSINYWNDSFIEVEELDFSKIDDDLLANVLEDVLNDEYKNFWIVKKLPKNELIVKTIEDLK